MKIKTVKDLVYFCHHPDPSVKDTLTIKKGTILDAEDRASLCSENKRNLVRMERSESKRTGKMVKLIPFF